MKARVVVWHPRRRRRQARDLDITMMLELTLYYPGGGGERGNKDITCWMQ